MSSSYPIRFIERKDLDVLAWDRCIDNASNGLIYAYSFYLDHMARQWDALVLGDYDAVMPLTWNKKYGFYYLYQPFLCASLGLFGKAVDASMLEAFFKSIPRRFKYWDIYLNHGNYFQFSSYPLYERMNYVLSLSKDYAALYEGYRDNIKRNIKKAKQLGCYVDTNTGLEEVIQLALQQMKSFMQIEAAEFNDFQRLYSHLQQRGKAKIYGIRSAQKELLASAVFIFSHQRAYYILVGNHPNGKTIGASHALIDAFIQDHAGQNLLLDFEGSDIRNLAFFYSSFGGTEEKYPGIKYNRLPPLLKWLKR